MPNALSILAAAAALVGFAGMIYGVTGQGEARRALGLRLLQGGMTMAGFLLITNSFVVGPEDDIYSGILLLVLGTGATAIHPKKSR
jgi:hypothetical protein